MLTITQKLKVSNSVRTRMANQCTLCLRSSLKATSRSHSNIGTLRRQYVNLQKKKIGGVSIRLCTKCLKTIKKKTPSLIAA